MQIRRFTDRGLERFDEVREGNSATPLKSILADSLYSEPISNAGEVEERQFESRFAVGEYFNSVLTEVPDQRTWAWLAAFYYDELCPDGRPGERARWVPALSNFQRYYRHLLAGPYLVYKAHLSSPRRAMAVLANRPHQPGDIAEQLVSRQEIVTNPAVMEVATRLYIDPRNDSPKRGAGGQGPGSPRRLAAVVDQLDLTWDLYALTSEQLLDLLPSEFDAFR